MSRPATLLVVPFLAALVPGFAEAEELRDFCPDRPGLGTPACIIDRGHVAAELGLMAWTLNREPGSRTDAFLVGDLLVRYGITDSLETQIGWTAFGDVRARSGDIVEHNSATGDVLVAIRQSVRNPDGSGLAIALMPQMTLPTGGSIIGAGDWSAGLLLLTSSELPDGFQLGFTATVEASVDSDGDGRHLSYGGIVGLDLPVGESVGSTIEFSARRDRDPIGAVSELLGGISASWSPADLVQVDAGANIGLNRNSPDLQLYLGVARGF